MLNGLLTVSRGARLRSAMMTAPDFGAVPGLDIFPYENGPNELIALSMSSVDPSADSVQGASASISQLVAGLLDVSRPFPEAYFIVIVVWVAVVSFGTEHLARTLGALLSSVASMCVRAVDEPTRASIKSAIDRRLGQIASRSLGRTMAGDSSSGDQPAGVAVRGGAVFSHSCGRGALASHRALQVCCWR